MDRAFAAWCLAIGLFFLSPVGGRRLESWNSWLRRKMPILNRIPGVAGFYSRESQQALRWFVGAGFCVLGVLGVLGAVRFGWG